MTRAWGQQVIPIRGKIELQKRPEILGLPEDTKVSKGRQEQDNVDTAEMHVDAVWCDSIG